MWSTPGAVYQTKDFDGGAIARLPEIYYDHHSSAKTNKHFVLRGLCLINRPGWKGRLGNKVSIYSQAFLDEIRLSSSVNVQRLNALRQRSMWKTEGGQRRATWIEETSVGRL